MSNKIIDNKEIYVNKILKISLFLILLILSYQIGKSHSKNQSFEKINLEIKPLTASNPREKALIEMQTALENQGISIAKLNNQPGQEVVTNLIAGASDENCAFIGSINSDKYHLPDSSWAVRIKPENRVCFSSAEEAQAKGYSPSSSLNK